MSSFVFSDYDRTITVYGFLPDTGEYIGKSDCYIPAGTGLPAYCTHKAAPVAPDGMAVTFDVVKDNWGIVEDHRGQTAYDTQTREPYVIKTLGSLPENLTFLRPNSEFDRWDGKQWEKDNEAEIQFQRQCIETKKQLLISEAGQHIDILTDKINLGLSSDPDSDRALLNEWQIYRVKIASVEASLVDTEIMWPLKPHE